MTKSWSWLGWFGCIEVWVTGERHSALQVATCMIWCLWEALAGEKIMCSHREEKLRGKWIHYGSGERWQGIGGIHRQLHSPPPHNCLYYMPQRVGFEPWGRGDSNQKLSSWATLRSSRWLVDSVSRWQSTGLRAEAQESSVLAGSRGQGLTRRSEGKPMSRHMVRGHGQHHWPWGSRKSWGEAEGSWIAQWQPVVRVTRTELLNHKDILVSLAISKTY